MAGKKKRKPPKTGPAWRMSVEEATLAGKPLYNGFACGNGVHGDCKYNRAKAKRDWRNEIRNERASRGPLELYRQPTAPRRSISARQESTFWNYLHQLPCAIAPLIHR